MGQRPAIRMVKLPRDAPFVTAQHRRSAREFDRRLIVVSDLAPSIRGVDRGWNGGEQFLQVLFAFPQALFGKFSLSNVACDLGSADDATRAIADWRNRQRYVEQTPVFSATNGFKMLDPVAAADARKNAGLFALAIGGNEHSHRFSYRLLPAVAEQPFGTIVPGPDDAVEVFADDCVLGGFDDRGQLLCVALGKPARLLARQPRQAKPQQARQSERNVCFGLAEVMRSAMIGHELARQGAVLDDRYESGCTDILAKNGFAQALLQLGAFDVAYADGS